MTDRRYDPQGYHETWQAKLEAAVNAFTYDEFPMTDAVFKATLFGLGFRGQELDAQFNYYDHLKLDHKNRKKALDTKTIHL